MAVPQTRASPVRECHFLHTRLPISPAPATAGRHLSTGVATPYYPQPHLLEPGQARSPSLTHHPSCQRQGRIPSVDSGLGNHAMSTSDVFLVQPSCESKQPLLLSTGLCPKVGEISDFGGKKVTFEAGSVRQETPIHQPNQGCLENLRGAYMLHRTGQRPRPFPFPIHPAC